MSKYENEQVEHMAKVFKALSNPHRLNIFLKMMAGGCAPEETCSINLDCCCVGTFIKQLGLAPSTISHHVKELKQAGLVKVAKRGKTVECWLDQDAIKAFMGFFEKKELGMKEEG